MKKTILATALAAFAFTAFSPVANAAPVRTNIETAAPAQPFQLVHGKKRHGYGGYYSQTRYLTPRDVIRHLYRKGYRDPYIVGSQRNSYIVNAYDYRGRVQLVVSARDGDIISRKSLYRKKHRHFDNYGHGYRDHHRKQYRSGFTIYFGNRH